MVYPYIEQTVKKHKGIISLFSYIGIISVSILDVQKLNPRKSLELSDDKTVDWSLYVAS